MKTIDLLEESYVALSANKIRSGLTMLGIVIGIGSVIAMIAIGQGAQSDHAGRCLGSPGNTQLRHLRSRRRRRSGHRHQRVQRSADGVDKQLVEEEGRQVSQDQAARHKVESRRIGSGGHGACRSSQLHEGP